ncbi:MAG: hypothetical protein WAM82_27220 [Thermoanaerobaculia bacterium]
MSTGLSVAEVLANLEKRLAFHREQETLHREQEAVHREQAAFHAGEGEKVAKHLEAFKTVALPAAEFAAPPPAPPPPPEEPELVGGGKLFISRAVARVALSWPEGEAFGGSHVASEVNRRFSAKLRRPIDGRLAAVTLRRLYTAGKILLLREGKAYHEALYSRGVRPGS